MSATDQTAADMASGFAELLLHHRYRTGISQAELARRMGLDHTAICRLERGDSGPALPTVRRFIRYAGLTPDEVRGALAALFGLDPDTLVPRKPTAKR